MGSVQAGQRTKIPGVGSGHSEARHKGKVGYRLRARPQDHVLDGLMGGVGMNFVSKMTEFIEACGGVEGDHNLTFKIKVCLKREPCLV